MRNSSYYSVPYIENLPADWHTKRLKYLVDITTGSRDTVDADDDGQYPFYIRSPRVLRINSYEHDGEAVLLPGEGDIGKIFHYVANGKFDFHQRVYCLYNFKDIYGKYLWYYMQATFISEVEKGTNKTTVESLRLPMLQNFLVFLPPIDEQHRIVDELDRLCAEIDNSISEVHKKIETLELYRESTIAEVVTRGLRQCDNDIQVEWFGATPSHWNIKKLRFLGTLQNGISKDASSFGSGFPFVSYGDVYNNMELPNSVEGLVESNATDRRIFSVKRGDVFFTRTSETIEEIGFSSTCLTDIPNATFAGFLIRFRPSDDSLIPEYAKYYFRNHHLRKYFVKEMMIVTRASLGQNLLKNLPVLIPPKEEQQEIAQYIDERLTKINECIDAEKKYLSLLHSYRQSAIYEYVTGKKRVKEVTNNAD